jgi:hypothetical protein
LLEGYLEAVERFQARGWTFNRDQPERHFEVEFLVAGQSVGTTEANIYRVDLKQGGVGRGDHAFVFNFPDPLSDEVLGAVTVRVLDGETLVPLERLPDADARAEPVREPPRQIAFAGVCQDKTQHPLFILGAARSGTTAVTQGLLKSTRYRGEYEGHMLDLLAEFYVTLDRFYDFKGDEWSEPTRHTTIKHVPIQFFREGLDILFIQAMGGVFPEPYWLDKTPTANMIHISPSLRRIWPNAKFIFLKRRAFENVMSRSRKFAGPRFEFHCKEWSESLAAWTKVASQLRGCALEIDQFFIGQSPEETSAEIGAFLELSPDETERFAQALALDRPERTGSVFSQVYDASELDWDAGKWKVFDTLCGPQLEKYGYSRDRSYFASDDHALRIRRI